MSDVLVVTGPDRVADAFRRLAGRVADQDEALGEWAERVEADAGGLVPIDTGALAATLTARTSGDQAYVVAGTGLDYAHLVEPFFKRAAGEHDRQVLDLVEDDIGSAIREVGLG